jgi:hypothetical protein
MNRTGETGQLPQRNQRFYLREGYYYYTTRENIDIGPFDSLRQAEVGVGDFIDFVGQAEPQVKQSLTYYAKTA